MKKQEPKAAELAQNARKNMNDAAEATRKAAGDASAKISKLMGSSPEPSFDESGAMAREDAAPSESRLDKLKAAFKPKEDPSVVALRAEVAELREEVARLAARVEELRRPRRRCLWREHIRGDQEIRVGRHALWEYGWCASSVGGGSSVGAFLLGRGAPFMTSQWLLRADAVRCVPRLAAAPSQNDPRM